MPLHYKIDTSLKVILSTATGSLKATDVDEHRKLLGEDQHFSPGFAHLIDLRLVTDLQISPRSAQSLSAKPIFGPVSKRAFVVNSDLLFGMSRIFRGWHDSALHMEIFRSMDDAIKWLGVVRAA
ncbi:MAG: hypothetical protein E2O59_10255 [Gammaproteobacteria bacterium]|nr:MAG: hypothetical protein E2O59_10255 [Gammaproteobacteria bacterium]